MLAFSRDMPHNRGMGWSDQYDFELAEMVDEAVEEGLLDEHSAGYGVAQQVITQGRESLSARQAAVFDGQVVDALKKLERHKPKL